MHKKAIVVFICLIFVAAQIAASGMAADPDYYYYGWEADQEHDPEPDPAPWQAAYHGELSGRVVILDPGHNISTANKYAGYDEQVTMLRLAHKIKPLLEARGAAVYLTVYPPYEVTLPQRAAYINMLALEAVKEAGLEGAARAGENGGNGAGDAGIPGIDEIDRLIRIMQGIMSESQADDSFARTYMNYPFSRAAAIHPDMRRVFELEDDPVIRERFLVISLHSNATPAPINTSANGASAHYTSNSDWRTSGYYDRYSYELLSHQFGELLLDRIDALGIRKRGSESDNLFIMREHNLPGVLVENGFHTNAGDRANLSDDAFLDRLAAAYADAVAVYYNTFLPHGFHAQPPQPSPPSLPYIDVNEDMWYFSAVVFLSEYGIVNGTSPKTFSPDDGMTRAMFAVALARLDGADCSGYEETPYDDVPIGSWYGKAVAWAADNGITEVGQDLLFKPDSYITREDIAHMIYLYLQYRQLVPPTRTGDYVRFEDDDDIDDRLRESVNTIRLYGIISGNGHNLYYPKGTSTRAEAAQAFCNVIVFLSLSE